MPENALLSHDLFEGLHARVALVSDVELVDDYPSSVLAHARRQHRWIRGDWQILFWLFPFVPSRDGLKRNTLPLIARWKILDNLRRSLVAPTLLALLVAGWTVLPGAHWFWTTAVLVVAGVAAAAAGRAAARRAAAERSRSPVFWRNLREDAATALGAGRARPDVPRLPRLRYGARDRADAGPPRVTQAAAARVGNGGGDRGAGRRPRRRPARCAGSPSR